MYDFKTLDKKFCLLTHRNQSRSVGSNHYRLDPNYLEQYRRKEYVQ